MSERKTTPHQAPGTTGYKAAFGLVMREQRLTRGLSLDALAAATGMPVEYIDGIERGEGNPTATQLNAVAEALDSPLGVLLKESERLIERHATAQRGIVLRLLDNEHPQPWTHSELAHANQDLDPQILAAALAQLIAAGVAIRDGEQIRASRCALRLDTLGMISV